MVRFNEDKEAWCRAAECEEREFVAQRLIELGIEGQINPQKAVDKFTHDLVLTVRSELKTRKTPFFMAKTIFGLDPQYAVTLNYKDERRYAELYPDIIVMFDVKWEELSKTIGGTTYEVQPMHETYAGFLGDIRRAIEADGGQRHRYRNRVDDTNGNAKTSWIFDVRRLHRLTPLSERGQHGT